MHKVAVLDAANDRARRQCQPDGTRINPAWQLLKVMVSSTELFIIVHMVESGDHCSPGVCLVSDEYDGTLTTIKEERLIEDIETGRLVAVDGQCILDRD